MISHNKLKIEEMINNPRIRSACQVWSVWVFFLTVSKLLHFFSSFLTFERNILEDLVTDGSKCYKTALSKNYKSNFCFPIQKVQLQVVKVGRRKHSFQLQFILSDSVINNRELLGIMHANQI